MRERVRLSLIAACIALVLAALPWGSAVASGPVDGPRLAVLRDTLFPFRFELVTVNEAGALPTRIAGGGIRKRPLPEEFTLPSWSPDGSMLVFAGLAGRIDDGPRGSRLFVSSAEGGHPRPLKGTHNVDEPKFAPDGRTVYFARYTYRPKVDQRGKKEFVPRGTSIWSVDVFGGKPRRITPSKAGLWIFPSSLSVDGRELLATQASGPALWSVVKLQLDTGAKAIFMRNASDPVLSPDGSRIAFLRARRLGSQKAGADEWTNDLFTVRFEGGGLRRITRGPGVDYSPSWDPSGERLAFIRYLPERVEPEGLGYGSAVLQVNADGSCLSPVLAPSLDVAYSGIAWRPGPGREAGRISC